jgi:ferric-dicitrate binding protein FerR (iron transport regulator)/tetratricopeptide (TPR) repeat protein
VNCEQALHLISARLDRELTDDDRPALEAHLRDCPACAAAAEAFQAQDANLRRAFAPRREALAAVEDRIITRLRLGSHFAPRRRLWFDWRLHALLAAAAGIVVLLYLWEAGGEMGSRLAVSKAPPAAMLKAPPPVVAMGGGMAGGSGMMGGGAPAQLAGLTPRPRVPPPEPPALAVGERVRTESGERRRYALPGGSILYLNQNTAVALDDARHLQLNTGQVFVEESPLAAGGSSQLTVRTGRQEVLALSAKVAVTADPAGPGVLVAQGKAWVSGLQDVVLAGQQLAPGAKEVTPAPRASHALDWTRDLMAAADSPLVPGSRYGGGALVAVDPQGQEARLNLRNYHVDVHIEDGFARTTIDQTYFNDAPWRLEGTFYFPLPPDASLSRLAMYVDGNLMEGGMAEREHAQRVYETILRSQRDPALLEWVDGSTFKMRVFPLEGRQEKRIILSYVQRLPTLYGRTSYRFPTGHSLNVVRDWSFRAHVRHGAGLTANSPTHPHLKGDVRGDDLELTASARNVKLDRDVAVELVESSGAAADQVRFTTAEHEGSRYLMVRYRPRLAVQPRPQRRDWVFLFESSADRDPLVARTQVEIVRALLSYAEPDDTFAVVTAAARVRTFADEPRPVTAANIQAALQFLDQAHLVGTLDLAQALAAAGHLCESQASPYLIHLGSGIPALGERRDDGLAKHLPLSARYVGIGVGKRWNRSFMKQQAERSGGYFTQINPDEPIAWRCFEVFATLNTPRLLNVQVVDNAEQARFLTFATTAAQGEEVAAVTHLEPGQPLPTAVTVRGTLDGEPFERVLPVRDTATDADYLPRTWAKLEIDRLLAEDAARHKDAIVALSKAMYVMTPFTSLLVLENEAMYRQFQVDRGRKDHWAMYPCPEKIPVVYEPDPNQPPGPPSPGTPATREQVMQTVVIRVPPAILGRAAPETAEVQPRRPVIVGNEVTWQAPGVQRMSRLFDSGRAVEVGQATWSLGLALAAERSDSAWYFQRFRKELRDRSVRTEIGEIVSDFDSLDPRPNQPPVSEPFVMLGDRTHNGREGLAAMAATGRRAFGVRVTQETTAGGFVLPNSRVDVVWVKHGDNESQSRVILHDVPVLAVDTPVTRPDDKEAMITSGTTLAVRPEQAELLSLAQEQGTLRLVLRSFDGEEIVRTSGVSPKAAAKDVALSLERRLLDGHTQPPRAYQRPAFNGDDGVFTDLVAYARGLNTSSADLDAVLEAEAAPVLASLPGQIEAAARHLIEQARGAGWQKMTLADGQGSLVFDGRGRFLLNRALSLGLREQVVCDGATRLDLYPELGLAARRVLSRFHRAELLDLVPWALPPAEDLARGADLRAVDATTVAVVPRGAENTKDADGKSVPYAVVQLHFADGRLSERRLVRMPAGETILCETYAADGPVKRLDAKGHVLAEHKLAVAPAAEPDLTPDTSDLLVLPMPLRSREHVYRRLGLTGRKPLCQDENRCFEFLAPGPALELFLAEFAAGQGDNARQVFAMCFAARGAKPVGFWVLLAACGVNVGADPEFRAAWDTYRTQPIGRYLALQSSPGYRAFQQRWDANLGDSVAPRDSFLGRLAAFRDLYLRWQDDPARLTRGAAGQARQQRALDFVRRERANPLGWALLGILQDRAGNPDLHAALAEEWQTYAKDAGLSYTARYEGARSLLRAGRQEQARKEFRSLYTAAITAGVLPPIDGDLRLALLGDKGDDDAWDELMHQTAAQLTANKRRTAVVRLAWQCWQVGDQPLATRLLELALQGPPEGDDKLAVTLAAVEFLWQTRQLPQADQLLEGLRQDAQFKDRPGLWRLAARLAQERGMEDRSLNCLEQALDLEYAHLPEVVDLQALRNDYGRLLRHYQAVANSQVPGMGGAGVAGGMGMPAGGMGMPPGGMTEPDLLAKAVRAADRWRALDRETGSACEAAAAVAAASGEEDVAWDYLTTPYATAAHGGNVWRDLGERLSREGKPHLADRAFRAACRQEPENAQLLWERIQNLRHAGLAVQAEPLLRRLAEGEWPPQYRGMRSQARRLLEGR